MLCGVCIGRLKAVHKKWMDDNDVVDDKEPPVLVDSADEDDESDGSEEDTTQEEDASGDDDKQAEGEAAVQEPQSMEQEAELLPQDVSTRPRLHPRAIAKLATRRRGSRSKQNPRTRNMLTPRAL
jgi:hypothetical protein